MLQTVFSLQELEQGTNNQIKTASSAVGRDQHIVAINKSKKNLKKGPDLSFEGKFYEFISNWTILPFPWPN